MSTTTTPILSTGLQVTPTHASVLAEPLVKWLTEKQFDYVRGSVLGLDQLSVEIAGENNTFSQQEVIPYGKDITQQFSQLTLQFTTIINLELRQLAMLRIMLKQMAKALQTGGHFIAITQASVALYKELSQGALLWSTQNINVIKSSLGQHYKLVKGRCFIIKDNASTIGDDAQQKGFAPLHYIGHVPVFAFSKDLPMFLPGGFTWFALTKIKQDEQG